MFTKLHLPLLPFPYYTQLVKTPLADLSSENTHSKAFYMLKTLYS